MPNIFLEKYEELLNFKEEILKDIITFKIVDDLTEMSSKNKNVNYSNVTWCDALSCVDIIKNQEKVKEYVLNEKNLEKLCDVDGTPLSKNQKEYVWATLFEAVNILNDIEEKLSQIKLILEVKNKRNEKECE